MASFAFSIPHVADDIVTHLSPIDIQQCSLVSKDLHRVFYPYTWRSLVITRLVQYNQLCQIIQNSKGKVLVDCQPKVQRLSSVFGETLELFVTQSDSTLTTTSSSSLSSPDPSPAAREDLDDVVVDAESLFNKAEEYKRHANDNTLPPPTFSLREPFGSLTTLLAASEPNDKNVYFHNANYVQPLLAIVAQSPRLQVLELNRFCPGEYIPFDELASIIRQHKTLKSLTLIMDGFDDCGSFKQL
ncbi:hypothetical protein BG004_003591, partial [Podila humilis]